MLGGSSNISYGPASSQGSDAHNLSAAFPAAHAQVDELSAMRLTHHMWKQMQAGIFADIVVRPLGSNVSEAGPGSPTAAYNRENGDHVGSTPHDQGPEYALHKVVLAQSPFLARLLGDSGPWGRSGRDGSSGNELNLDLIHAIPMECWSYAQAQSGNDEVQSSKDAKVGLLAAWDAVVAALYGASDYTLMEKLSSENFMYMVTVASYLDVARVLEIGFQWYLEQLQTPLDELRAHAPWFPALITQTLVHGTLHGTALSAQLLDATRAFLESHGATDAGGDWHSAFVTILAGCPADVVALVLAAEGLWARAEIDRYRLVRDVLLAAKGNTGCRLISANHVPPGGLDDDAAECQRQECAAELLLRAVRFAAMPLPDLRHVVRDRALSELFPDTRMRSSVVLAAKSAFYDQYSLRSGILGASLHDVGVPALAHGDLDHSTARLRFSVAFPAPSPEASCVMESSQPVFFAGSIWVVHLLRGAHEDPSSDVQVLDVILQRCHRESVPLPSVVYTTSPAIAVTPPLSDPEDDTGGLQMPAPQPGSAASPRLRPYRRVSPSPSRQTRIAGSRSSPSLSPSPSPSPYRAAAWSMSPGATAPAASRPRTRRPTTPSPGPTCLCPSIGGAPGAPTTELFYRDPRRAVAVRAKLRGAHCLGTWAVAPSLATGPSAARVGSDSSGAKLQHLGADIATLEWAGRCTWRLALADAPGDVQEQLRAREAAAAARTAGANARDQERDVPDDLIDQVVSPWPGPDGDWLLRLTIQLDLVAPEDVQ